MKNVPERIWLQVNILEHGDWDDSEGVTWCVDKIYDDDVEYVRAPAACPAPQGGVPEEVREAIFQLVTLARMEGRCLKDAAVTLAWMESVRVMHGSFSQADNRPGNG